MKKIILMAAILAGISVPVRADRLDDMISPVTDPVNFEDPRIQTEVRPIYIYHSIDEDFITQGGSAQIWALQLRAAVTEDLAVIATKDGWVELRPDTAVDDQSGFGNLAAGLKYAVLKDASCGSIVSVGLTYEAPTGEKEVFQGTGDGYIRPLVTSAWALGDTVNLLGSTDLRIPVDADDDSMFWDLDLHVDTKLGSFYPFVEMNLIHILSAGDRLPIADEGADYFNFGASLSDGETIVTGGVGARYRVTDGIDVGVGYQFPLTSGPGSNLFDWRITTDAIFRFDI